MTGPSPGEARVTILVPARNRSDLTGACLTSVKAHTRAPHEVVLIDAGSDAGESRALAALARECGADFLRLEENTPYAVANNRGADRAPATRYLCLLNNDTEVTPGWLTALLSAADRMPSLGVLGNRHLFPGTGKLHHCGIAFDDRGMPAHLHPHAPADFAAASFDRDVPAVTFACVLIPRAAWDALGGLDEQFQTGCEDIDFCLRARAAGLRVAYTPSSTIYHHGQATPGRTDHDQANQDRLRELHGTPDPGSLQRLTRAGEAWTARTGKRFRAGLPAKQGPEIHLAIDFSTASAFCWAGAELAMALDALGIRVSTPVQTFDETLPARHRAVLGRMRRRPAGRDVHIKFSHYWPGSLNRSLQGDLNIEFFSSNFFWNPAGHRDLWLENVLLNGYRKAPVSSFAAEALVRAGIPEPSMHIVPHGYAPEIDEVFPRGVPERPHDGPLNLFVVTNCADLNRYGSDVLLDALEEAYGDAGDVHLHIRDYGAWSGASPLQDAYAARRLPPVTWHTRFLPKAEFIRLHGDMDLLVAPFRGEGFGMKIADAMAAGLPVLMPPCAGPADLARGGGVLPIRFEEVPMGPCYDRSHLAVGDSATWFEPDRDHLVEQLRHACDHRDQLRDLGREGRDFVRREFSWARAATALLDGITGWQQERASTVCLRRQPTGPGITVVIPTHLRNERLEKTLDGYAHQADPGAPVDVVIVNDGGPRDDVETLARSFAPGLTIGTLHHDTARGPAAARNRALAVPRREHILITGDDIVPAGDFIKEHLAAHRHHPQPERAFVGLTRWHPDVPQDWFTDLLAGPGGQQFNYEGLRHGHQAPFDRFYTSNVSLKWSLLAEEENLFSTCYGAAAYEDVEFGYRLAQRGMKLCFWETAVAHHLHPQTPESFLDRQVMTGRMLTVFAKQRPCFMPLEHSAFLHMLEQLWSREPRPDAPGAQLDPYALLRELAAWLSAMGDAEEPLSANGTYGGTLAEWFGEGRHHAWRSANELALRIGMAEEWAQDGPYRDWALGWTTCAVIPRMFGMPDGHPPLPTGGYHRKDILLPNSRFAYELSKRLRAAPIIGRAVRRFEMSPSGISAREWLLRHLRR